MLYKYDKSSLQYVKTKQYTIIYILCIVILIGSFYIKNKPEESVESEVLVILLEQNKFSEEKLITHIKEMNFRFPYIVYAQSVLETGNFSSPVFKENNNLFGMKEAKITVTLSKGTKRKHAYYTNWRESLYDYGMYYSTYLYKITTEENYYNYLQQYYAENPEYVSKLKEIIKQKDLINKFK